MKTNKQQDRKTDMEMRAFESNGKFCIDSREAAKILEVRHDNQMKTNKQQEAIEQAKAVYKTYQENILKADTLQNEIIKGLNQGENITVLFLKALEIIGCMTGETVTYQTAKETVMTVYGYALKEPDSLEIARTEIQERLIKMQKALESTEGAKKERLLCSIKAHKEKLDKLK